MSGEAPVHDQATPANHQGVDYVPAAPHDPDMSGTHTPLRDVDLDINENEKQIFDYLLKPDDSYNSEGIYWAGLPIPKRIRFVAALDGAETKRELSGVWHMMKKDPLSPIAYYLRNMVLPGAGLGLEGYVLFSIGNLKPLFAAAFPECWGTKSKKHPKNGSICSSTWIAAVDYLEICGIICGQIL